MAPRHQLIVSVGLIAAVIVVAWVVLFRQHVLAPPITMPIGPSIPDIGKQFEEQVNAFGKLAPAAPVNVPPVSAPPITIPPVNIP